MSPEITINRPVDSRESTHPLDPTQTLSKPAIHNHDIELIILQICAEDRHTQQKHKWVLIGIRALDRTGQTQQSEEKAGAYLSTAGLTWATAGVVFQMSAAFCGQSLPGGIFSAMGLGAQKTGEYADQIRQSHITIIDHSYHSAGEFIREESSSIQGAEQDYKGDMQAMERVLQEVQRVVELIFSGQ